MTDPLLTAGLALVPLYLLVVITSALALEHTEVSMPRALSGLKDRRGGGRRSLMVELPWALAIIGGGEFVMVGILLHANSTALIRLIALGLLVASAGWIAFLARRITVKEQS